MTFRLGTIAKPNSSSKMPPFLSPMETIAAISTPPGRGGIGVVRLSGPDALFIAGQLVQFQHPPVHARAGRARVLDPDDPSRTIDEAVVTAFLAPHSYTGDTLVEIAAHGSPVVLDALLRNALSNGARLAMAGEFTQRSFLSGRLDLTQAEAIHDLIAAQTLDQVRVAAQQLGGSLSRRVAPAKDQLVGLIVLLEAGMDFASGELDDVDIVPGDQIAGTVASIQHSLEKLAASFRTGQILRNGAAIALIGSPNAGKSSLFNCLLVRDRAIVTPAPGTTRDTIEESFSLGGIPLRLMDTAGLRSGSVDEAAAVIDLAEEQGIARSREALADADLVVLIHDATQPLTDLELELATSLTNRPHLIVHNKVDLLGEHTSAVRARPQHPLHKITGDPPDVILTSALTGEGLDQLRRAILAELGASGSLIELGSLNNQRQQEAILATLAALTSASAANASSLPHELILLDLHTALQALDSLTGATTPDDILAGIFSTFCIGK